MTTTLNPDLERDGLVLHRIHERSKCLHREVCIMHAPTDHHMRSFPLHWRGDRGIFERICPHGIGHPDPDQDSYWEEMGETWQWVHGCDGCCAPPPEQDPHIERGTE